MNRAFARVGLRLHVGPSAFGNALGKSIGDSWNADHSADPRISGSDPFNLGEDAPMEIGGAASRRVVKLQPFEGGKEYLKKVPAAILDKVGIQRLYADANSIMDGTRMEGIGANLTGDKNMQMLAVNLGIDLYTVTSPDNYMYVVMDQQSTLRLAQQIRDQVGEKVPGFAAYSLTDNQSDFKTFTTAIFGQDLSKNDAAVIAGSNVRANQVLDVSAIVKNTYENWHTRAFPHFKEIDINKLDPVAAASDTGQGIHIMNAGIKLANFVRDQINGIGEYKDAPPIFKIEGYNRLVEGVLMLGQVGLETGVALSGRIAAKLGELGFSKGTVRGFAIGGAANAQVLIPKTLERWYEKVRSKPMSIAEARAVAEKNGADIPDFMVFQSLEDAKFVARFGEKVDAAYTFVQKERGTANTLVTLKNEGNAPSMLDKNGKMTVTVKESVLTSDRATTYVFAHEGLEGFELYYEARRLGGAMTGRQIDAMTQNSNPLNAHGQAVEYGDQLVWDMIKRGL
ncbi:hypothetical protein F2P45_33780 [Massilia sp. CCM 8733]|uniref:Uncharacterized protein n=2 Tax=Massilia mucilaginosa TaxID=2609282 RepID=A0ABX0P4A6_9BURK|nr:hypothetical protein [Massilia mucilaginosa]